MFNKQNTSILKYVAAFGVLGALTACSDDDVVNLFDPSVAPADVQVVSGDGNSTGVQNTVSWTEVPGSDVDYVVYWSNTAGVTESSSQVDPAFADFDSATHTGTDVVAGGTYYYRVQAVSGSQVSVLSDEVTGTPQASVTPSQLNDVAWNGLPNTLVAVGDSGTIIISQTGLTDGWTTVDLSSLEGFDPSNSLGGVTWENTNSQFLVVGAGGTVLTSANGTAWSLQPTPASTDLEDVTWLGDRYIAVGASGTIWTSNINGSDWAPETVPPTATTDTLEGVASNASATSNASTIVAVGTNGTVLTSADGTNWAEVDVGETNNLNDVTWDGSQFVIVGSNDTVLTSPDGATWTPIIPGTPNVTFVGASQWDSSIPADPILAAVGSAGTFIASLDTIDGLSIDTGTNEQLNGITWVDDGTTGYFVIVGNDGTVLTAQDQE